MTTFKLSSLYNQTPAVILCHAYVGKVLGKSVHGILMHSTLFKIVSLIDRESAGEDTSKICPGVSKCIPIVSNLAEALKSNPRVLIIMDEPKGEISKDIKTCIKRGIDIINPTFEFLKNNAALQNMAKLFNSRLIDLRDYAYVKRWPDGSILNIKAHVIFVTGTDCGIGKRTAAYELTQAAKRRGIHAAFAATGQTGLMIGCDDGIVFDAIPTNFAAGAVEKLIVDLDNMGFELIFLEGQASLMHFACSSSIALLHASNPHAILLVHDEEREYHAEYGSSEIFRMCKLMHEIDLIESLSLPGGNCFKVVAIPTRGLHNIGKIRQLVDLPVADARSPGGPDILLNAVLSHLENKYGWKQKGLHKETSEISSQEYL